MSHRTDAASRTRRQIRFANVSMRDEVLLVRTLKDPCLYDLRVLALEQWLPMMVLGCGLFYAVSGFRQVLPCVQAGLFITVWCGIPLVQVLWNTRNAAVYTFDRVSSEVFVNGRRIGSLAQGTTVLLQTRWGWSGNRRFRLVVRLHDGEILAMTQTPLLEDGAHAGQYYGETYSRTWMSGFKPWADDQGERDAIDNERDAGIFALYEEVSGFLSRI